jgi:hypothetical protein
MICEKCGTNVPIDRNTCINCGIPVNKPDWVEEIEKKSSIEAENFSFKGKNRLGYYGVASGTMFIGLIVALILFLRFPFLPGLIFAAIVMLTIFPLIGMIMVSTGMYRVGCVFTCIGAYTCFPIGIAGRKYLMRVWNFGIQTKEMIKNGEKKFIKDGMVVKPPLPMTIGIIVIIVVLLLAPVFSYIFIMNKPMIHISSYHVPSQYSIEGRVEVKVTLYNYGHQTANGEKIQILIEGSGAGKLNWGEGDLGTMNSEMDRFNIQSSGRLEKIVVYYDGEKVAEQEIEGLWMRT